MGFVLHLVYSEGESVVNGESQPCAWVKFWLPPASPDNRFALHLQQTRSDLLPSAPYVSCTDS